MSTPQANDVTSTRNLVLLFAGLYTIEGLCALSGLTRQPFDHFGKDVAGWSAVHLASMHALLALPWAVKPIYGGACRITYPCSAQDVGPTSLQPTGSPRPRVSCSG